MYTREEFEQFRKEEAAKMTADKQLKRDALKLIENSSKYHYIHQTTFMGEPCLQLPQDLFVMQEIIFKTRPKYVI
jgi:cephalosporin hydroxylase